MMVKSSFWYAVWQGNNPNSEGTDKLKPETPYGYLDYL